MTTLTRNLLIIGLALAVWGISFLFTGDSTPDDPTKEVCHAQLDEIQRAKQQWAKDNKQPPTAIPQQSDLLQYFPKHQMPQCPGGGNYILDSVTNSPQCSIETHTYP